MSDTIPVGGYLDADLIMNQWNGGYNPGEVQFGTSIFNFIHPNGTVWESVSDGRGSVSGMEGTASGTTTYYRDAYLVFVGSDINRFSMGDFNDGMDFVIAYWDGDQWTYDNNSGYDEYRVFTPNDNDCIVAQLWRDTLAPPGIDDMETFFLPTGNYDTGVVNYIPDPSFLTQTWQPPFPDPEAGVHNGYLEFSDEESLLGGYSIRHYTDGGSTYTNGQVFNPNPTNGLSEAMAGETWIFSAWCKVAGIFPLPIKLYIFGLDSNQEWISTQYIGDESVGDCTTEWQEFSNEITFDSPDVSYVTVRVDHGDGGAGWSVYWDALQLSPYTPPQGNAPIIQVEVN